MFTEITYSCNSWYLCPKKKKFQIQQPPQEAQCLLKSIRVIRGFCAQRKKYSKSNSPTKSTMFIEIHSCNSWLLCPKKKIFQTQQPPQEAQCLLKSIRVIRGCCAQRKKHSKSNSPTKSTILIDITYSCNSWLLCPKKKIFQIQQPPQEAQCLLKLLIRVIRECCVQRKKYSKSNNPTKSTMFTEITYSCNSWFLCPKKKKFQIQQPHKKHNAYWYYLFVQFMVFVPKEKNIPNPTTPTRSTMFIEIHSCNSWLLCPKKNFNAALNEIITRLSPTILLS